LALIGLIAGIAAPAVQAKDDAAHELVYFGTHGDKPGSEIFGAWFNEHDGTLTSLGEVAQVFRATWLEAMPRQPVLFAVSEAGNDGKSHARLISFRVDRQTGALTTISNVNSGGGGSTHLAYDPAAHALFTANFGSGSVSVVPVHPDGSLGDVAGIGQDVGTGPMPRQQSPHAHGVTVAPGGGFVLVPDLGADRTFVWRYDPHSLAITPGDPAFAQSVPGTGPRHLVFGADGRFAYQDAELTARVDVFAWDGNHGRLNPVQSVEVMPATVSGQRSAAEIAISHDGRFLYVSDREGENAVITYAIDHASGRLTEIQHQSVGARPWSFAISPGGRWLLIAEEGQSRITVWARDPATGKIAPGVSAIDVPRPVNVAFMR
jgi:6-phosphogluconolactonase